MMGKTAISTLGNGCRVVTSEMPGVESVSLCFDAGTGSRFESESELGFSHFLEHMLFKGSEKRRGTRAISQPLEQRGGVINAYTSVEHTCFHASVPYDAAPLAFDVVGDLFARPLFPPREIDRERSVVLEEIKMYHDDDASFVADQSQSALWPGHPLGRQILGTPESLAAAGRDALLAFHARRYRAKGAIVAAAGRVEHGRVVELAGKLAARLPGGAAPRAVPASRARPPARLVFEERESQQVQAVLAFRGLSYGDGRKSALSVLSQILGRGMTSRLFMSLREKRGLVYSVGTDVSLFSDAGSFQIFAGIDPARSEKAMALCAAELRRLVREPVGRTELRRAIGAIVGAQRMGGETSSSQMAWILGKVRNLGRVETPEETIARISAVTAEDVQALAADLFRPESMSLSLVVPRGGPVSAERLLAAVEL